MSLKLGLLKYDDYCTLYSQAQGKVGGSGEAGKKEGKWKERARWSELGKVGKERGSAESEEGGMGRC